MTAYVYNDTSRYVSYKDAVGNRWAMKTPMPASMSEMVLFDATEDIDKIAEKKEKELTEI